MNQALSVAKYLDEAPWKYGAMVCGLLCICICADAMEMMLPGYIIRSFENTHGFERGMIMASSVIGATFGSLLNAWYCDRTGRTPTIILTMAITFIGGFASTFARHSYDFAIYRLICGLGVGASGPSFWALGSEIFRAKDRGLYLSIMASVYSVAVAALAGTAWVILGNNLDGNRIYIGGTWRHLVFVSAIPSGLAVILCSYFLPESPRLLVEQGRIKQAVVWISKISGDKDIYAIEVSIKAGMYNSDGSPASFSTN